MRKANQRFGVFIKRARSRVGFKSLGQLGARTGLDPSTIWRIEKGITTPRIETLLKLAPALKLTLEEMMNEAGFTDEAYTGSEEAAGYRPDLIDLAELSQAENRDKVRSYFDFLKDSEGR